jgi:hypothetical protein
MSREIMQQALDALEYHTMQTRPINHTDKAIDALKAELAKPEQEPVAWMVRDQVDGCRYPSASKNPAGSINGESQPLYTAPSRKEWVGLTDEEKTSIFMQAEFNDLTERQMYDVVEAKLKEKNK